MTAETIYLICFLVGLFLSFFSVLSGSAHLHFHGFHHGHGHVHVHTGSHGSRGSSISPLNFGTFSAFLSWFGGAGYLLTRYSAVQVALIGILATITGLAGAALIFYFLAKVLISPNEDLDAADYDMIGILGRVSSSIREDGTGEMIFSQAGTRHAASARSETGEAIAKGSEVVVTRFEKGIAYVRPFDELGR